MGLWVFHISRSKPGLYKSKIFDTRSLHYKEPVESMRCHYNNSGGIQVRCRCRHNRVKQYQSNSCSDHIKLASANFSETTSVH